MNKLSCLAVVLAIAGVMGADAQAASHGRIQFVIASLLSRRRSRSRKNRMAMTTPN
jgi:hypothetical protein